MPASVEHPILVTYFARDTGIVHVAHESRQLLAGVGNIRMAISTLPLCRRGSALNQAEAVAIARRYVECSKKLRGGMTCSECAAVIARQPWLRDDAHLDLVRPDLRRHAFA